jgi:preprotein translocase subunit SecB
MAETSSNGSGAAAQQAADQAPSLTVLAQYVKDLSFENPNAPRSLGPPDQPPEIQIQVNVNARQLAETDFEAELVLEGSAVSAGATFFKFELKYAGVFRIRNVPEQEMHALVMIECPRIVFPFARQIVAEAVRNGGFPPLLIDPIDFQGLYRQRVAELQPNQTASA